MALLRAAALPAEGSPAWLPTHVQVTVIRARGLRCKGGGGGSGVTSDAYTVIQLGKEKYSTSVAEKSRGDPEWQEECAFELPPDMGTPAGLVLTVMHRALVGMDRFLGQALVPLEPALQRGRAPDERWHKLHSKAGKKEKERGEILVCIQFTRNTLTASMFDLSARDKPRSAFGKLKDKVKGKKKYDLESASAIVPSSSGALDDEDGRKPKARGFFLKNKLRKSSLTQSNTSLGSDSTASAAELPGSPSRHGSLAVVKDFLPSPKLTHKRAFSDDISQVSPVLEPKPIPNLKPKNDPVSSSSLCINGSHVYGDQPAPKSPGTLPPSSAPLAVPGVPRRQEESFGFTPLHPDSHEVPWGVGSFERAQQREEPRFIPSPPSLALQEELKVSTKAVTLSNHLGRARMEESGRSDNKPTQAAAPMVFSPETAKDKQPEEARKEEKKAKGGLFHHGANKSEVGSKVGASQGSAVHGGDERSKTSGWFGSKESKESPQKPSLEVSPQVETSSDAPSHFPPCSPAPSPPAALAYLARMPRSNLPAALGDAQAGCLSPTNPFLNSLQSNPFFEDLLADQVLNSPSPTHFFSSFPAEPHDPTEVAENFCSSEDCSPSVSLRHKDPERESPAKSVGVPVPETTPPAPGDLPPPPPSPPLEDEKPAVLPPLSEWDDTFDAFATSRLNPEQKKEKFFPSVGEEGMAFIDDPDVASPTERPPEGAAEGERKVLAEADPPAGSEMPTSLRSWSDFFGLDVGANLVSTTQEATVIEDVPSPVSVGSVGKRRKSSTPTVWMAAGNPGEEETLTLLTADNNAGEEGDSGEEEASGAGTNGWMTIATETAPDLPEDTLGVAEPESPGQEGAFSPHPASLGRDAFEAKSGSQVPRSTLTPELSSEPLPAGNVAAVPPRVLAEPRGGEEEAFDIRTSVYRLQASLRVEAGEGRVKLSSDVRERHVVVSPWAGTREREESASGSAVPPPKPPRWFAAAGRDGEEEEEERGEDVECPKADVELPKSRLSDEPSVPAPPSPPLLGTGIAGAGNEFLVSEDAESGTAGSAADLEERPSELAAGDTSLGEEQSKLNEMDTVEQFETCPSKFSLDGSGQLGVKESWSQLGLSSADGAKWETGLNPPSKLDQAETFWTALEETTAHPADLNPATQPQRLEQGEIPPEPDPGDGDRQPGPVTVPSGQGGAHPEAGSPVATAGPSREAEQGRPPSGEPEGSWRRRSAASRIDFKKADFWKVDREEERCEQEASTPRNPFANTPSNPFVEKPPTPLPIQAVPPEKLDQGSFSFTSVRQETPWRGSRPTNLLREPPFLHDNQPLAFSTPFLVAATNPKQFDFPSPVACPASSGVPSASSRAAAQPRPLPQSGGDAQASALVVLPRETQPAEKPFFQQTTSPHPVKPISAAVQEVSSEKKQQHRSSLSTALSNGLEKLKTVTTSSIQPVAPSSHLEKTDSQLKDPTTLDQSAKYYHLTHDELIQLLLQREKELSKKEEHIQELENYIDQLLVRIMEQSPTLLQIPLEDSKTK